MSELADAVHAQIRGALADVADLVSIPSVSSQAEHRADVDRAAAQVAQLLTELGCPDVQVIESGGMPAVVGRFDGPAGAPRVCLYAHYDVQPAGDPAIWATDPFIPTTVGDRLYGRGAADDKGGFGVHLAALRAFGGQLPVAVTVLVEGEEEIGSPTLGAMLANHRDLLAADVYIVTDSVNAGVGVPAVTTTLRGICDAVVEVRTLDHAVHSGQFGGAVPDAMTVLVRLLATLHHADGSVAVAGLVFGESAGPDYPDDRLRSDAGMLDGVEFLGKGRLSDRLWAGPAITIIGIDATSVADASNTLAPVARAKVSLRVAPGQTAADALDALVEHLESHADFGAQVTVTRGAGGDPSVMPYTGPVADAADEAFTQAWGRKPEQVGQGGSIPLAAEFQQAFPDAFVMLTAVVDPDSRMHGANESLHTGDFAKAAVTEALLLERLGRD